MKKLILALTILSQSTLAAKNIGSYYVKTFHDGQISSQVCETTSSENDEPVSEHECSLGDPADYYGYYLKYVSGDHALVPTITYMGVEIPFDQIYSDHQPNSGASHFYGVTNGTIEVRYKYNKAAREMQKVPFAIILRMDTSRAKIDEDGEIIFEGADEELLVFHLNGVNSKLIGKVNARQKGANQKARGLADTLL